MNYFGVRINISQSCPLETLTTYLSKYEHILGCFENADNEVRNDHTHILIWGPIIEQENFEKTFVDELKFAIKGVRGNGRYAVNHKMLDFETKACPYVCKGKIDTLPHIFINTDFNELEIENFWRTYWNVNLVARSKKCEDDSMRNIERIWRANEGAVVDLLENKVRHEGILHAHSTIMNFWYDAVVDHYHEEFKVWEDNKVVGVINGLALRTDKDLFKLRKRDKIFSLLCLNNREKNLAIDPTYYDD